MMDCGNICQIIIIVFCYVWNIWKTSLKNLKKVWSFPKNVLTKLLSITCMVTPKNAFLLMQGIFLFLFHELLKLNISSMTACDNLTMEELKPLFDKRFYFSSYIGDLRKTFIINHGQVVKHSKENDNPSKKFKPLESSDESSMEHDAVESAGESNSIVELPSIKSYGKTAAQSLRRPSKVFVLPADTNTETMLPTAEDESLNEEIAGRQAKRSRKTRKVRETRGTKKIFRRTIEVEVTIDPRIGRSILTYEADFSSLEDTNWHSYRSDLHTLYNMLKNTTLFNPMPQNIVHYFEGKISSWKKKSRLAELCQNSSTFYGGSTAAIGSNKYQSTPEIESYDVQIHDFKTELKFLKDVPFPAMIGLSANKLDIYRVDRSVEITVRIYDDDQSTNHDVSLPQKRRRYFGDFKFEGKSERSSFTFDSQTDDSQMEVEMIPVPLLPQSDENSVGLLQNQEKKTPPQITVMSCRSCNSYMQADVIGYDAEFYVSDDSRNTTTVEVQDLFFEKDRFHKDTTQLSNPSIHTVDEEYASEIEKTEFEKTELGKKVIGKKLCAMLDIIEKIRQSEPVVSKLMANLDATLGDGNRSSSPNELDQSSATAENLENYNMSSRTSISRGHKDYEYIGPDSLAATAMTKLKLREYESLSLDIARLRPVGSSTVELNENVNASDFSIRSQRDRDV